MHKIQEKEFTLEDFSCEHLIDEVEGDEFICSPIGNLRNTIKTLNASREKYLETKDKKYWWQMIQLLPSSYNQTRNVMMNYEVLANIYKSRKNHKLDEWREFCKWIEELPYSELIYNNKPIMTQNDPREKIRLDPVKEPIDGYVNIYGQLVPKIDHSNYNNAVFNGECD